MRIPRTNFPPASFHDHDEADGPDDHRAREGVALRRMRLLSETAAADQPSWERHFFLAPNVRFTRTPDRDLHPEQAAHMEAVDLPADSGDSRALTVTIWLARDPRLLIASDQTSSSTGKA